MLQFPYNSKEKHIFFTANDNRSQKHPTKDVLFALQKTCTKNLKLFLYLNSCYSLQKNIVNILTKTQFKLQHRLQPFFCNAEKVVS